MEVLTAHWSQAALVTNGILMLHLLGATAVGLLLGYERTYHGRAAGMRTYTLVCVASTMLTVINGYPGQWYGGLTVTPSGAASLPRQGRPQKYSWALPTRAGRETTNVYTPVLLAWVQI